MTIEIRAILLAEECANEIQLSLAAPSGSSEPSSTSRRLPRTARLIDAAQSRRILHVENDPLDRGLVAEALEAGGMLRD